MGFIIINKPAGITSHDVVNSVRKITGERRVGHAGTLDPLATGVLIIGVGREFTRQLGEMMKGTKEYQAVFFLGATSNTDDADGQISPKQNTGSPTRLNVETALTQFKGEIDQIPPQFSAIKMKGRSVHYLARKGIRVELKKRKVRIEQIEIINYQWPQLELSVVCGSGTYIRSLARDLGEVLGVGAYVKQLTRTRVGSYSLKEAITLEQFRVKEAAKSHNDTIPIT